MDRGILKIRQGDVGLAPIPAPKNPGKPKNRGRVVLALGEVTGHAHVIEGAVAEFLVDGERVLWVEATTKITHGPEGRQMEQAEHYALPIVNPGWYVIDDHQQEYTPQRIIRSAD